MLHIGVGSGVQDGFVAAVAPTHHIGRFPAPAAHLEDLAFAVHFASMTTSDDDAIANACLHDDLLLFLSSE
jgi:hypothetical protein